MKKVDTIIKEKNHFIGSWYIDEKPLDELIDYFNSSHVKHTPGKLENGQLDKTKKDCIELLVTPKEIEEGQLDIFRKYLKEIISCFNDYRDEWPFLSNKNPKIYIGPLLIEKFLVSGHHSEYHCDRMNILSSHKALSWITFLNDVKDGEGFLEFKHFNCSIQPKKGLTLIWPSDWTHIHRQNILKTQDKFIAKGCFQFSDI